MPMPLLCGSDFANHIKESKGPHNQMPLEGIRDWNLFFSVKKYLLKLNEEINLKAKKKILEIHEKFQKKVNNISEIIQNLNKEVHNKAINEYFIEEMLSNLKNNTVIKIVKFQNCVNFSEYDPLIANILKDESYKNVDHRDLIKYKSSGNILEKNERDDTPGRLPHQNSGNFGRTSTQEDHGRRILVDNKIYGIKSVLTGEFLYISKDKKDGNYILESKIAYKESDCSFLLRLTKDGYTFKSVKSKEYIYLTDKKGIRFACLSSSLTPKCFFEISYLGNGRHTLKSTKFSEFLFLSDDHLSGGKIVESKAEIDEKSGFDFIQF